MNLKFQLTSSQVKPEAGQLRLSNAVTPQSRALLNLDSEAVSDLVLHCPELGSNLAAGKGKTMLLGLGNDLLTDDGIGLRVAREIRRQFDGHQSISVVESSEMGLALLDLVVGYETLIIVDAIQTQDSPPGFVHELNANDLKALPAVSPHFLGVGELLALGRELGLSVPTEVTIFAVEVQDCFTVSAQLTPALDAALPDIVERVLVFCRCQQFSTNRPSV